MTTAAVTPSVASDSAPTSLSGNTCIVTKEILELLKTDFSFNHVSLSYSKLQKPHE